MSDDKMREALEMAMRILGDAPDLNPNSYAHEEACKLNTAANEAYIVLDAALTHHQAESEPVGVFGFVRKTFGETRQFQGYLCNGSPEPRNGDLLYLDPQPAARVPKIEASLRAIKAESAREFCQEIGLFNPEYSDQEYIDVSRDALREYIDALYAAPSIAEKNMPDFGVLTPPSATAMEVFKRTLENNPDADMRAIPNQWLLKERGLSSQFSDRIAELEAAAPSIAEKEKDDE